MSVKHSPHRMPEKTMRQLWQHQQFNTSTLITSEGKEVIVVFAGNLNTDGGPDFKDASIRIGGVLYKGDIELHQNYDAWEKHSHHRDPKYNGVILHVVFNGTSSGSPSITKSKRVLPVLVLDQYIPQSLQLTTLDVHSVESAGKLLTIPCAFLNDSVDAATIHTWLYKLAIERIELKVRRFEERIRELIDEQRLSINEPVRRYGQIPFGVSFEEMALPEMEYTSKDFSKLYVWNELLYESVMEALGYSKNQEAFYRLARAVPLRFFTDVLSSKHQEDRLAGMEAILFGVSGLLRQHGTKLDRRSRERIRTLRRLWRIYKPGYRGEMLNEADWQFFRLRPENFPTVRLAGAVRLIPQFLEGDIFKSIIQTVRDAESDHQYALKRLKSYFIVLADEFWSRHYYFGEEAGVAIKKLIGEHRAQDIILNVVLPVCLLYARIFKEKHVRQGVLRIFEQSPRSSANIVTRTMEQQLIKGKFDLDTALMQQGVLQLYKLYCVEERCKECSVGKAVFAG